MRFVRYGDDASAGGGGTRLSVLTDSKWGEQSEMRRGTIGWIDLTVSDAEQVRDFYQAVVGWTASLVNMGDYEDYSMNAPEDGEPIAGVCHALGGNADLPSTWMIYIVVDDLEHSMERCQELGGTVVVQPRQMGKARYCVIRDPGGATCSLYQPGE